MIEEHFSSLVGYTASEWRNRCAFERMFSENVQYEGWEDPEEELSGS